MAEVLQILEDCAFILSGDWAEVHRRNCGHLNSAPSNLKNHQQNLEDDDRDDVPFDAKRGSLHEACAKGCFGTLNNWRERLQSEQVPGIDS